MKKSLSILAFAGLLAIVACGPGEDDKKAMDKKRTDSIAKADSVAAASVATAAKAKQDSVNMAMEKAKADSVASAADGKKDEKKKK